MKVKKNNKNIISKNAVAKTDSKNSQKYMTIEQHIFRKDSQIANLLEYHDFDFINFIDCTFINIDFSIFRMVANDFKKCNFKDCGIIEEFYENNSFEDCLWGNF